MFEKTDKFHLNFIKDKSYAGPILIKMKIPEVFPFQYIHVHNHILIIFDAK